MTLPKPEQIFPGRYRQRVFQPNNEWHNPEYAYSSHLEIKKLAYYLEQIASQNGVKWYSTRINVLLNELEPDPAKIRRRDELIEYARTNPELEKALLQVRPTKYNDKGNWISNNELRTRFVQHLTNVRQVVNGIRSAEEPNEFYQQVLAVLEPELTNLETVEEELEKHYELSANVDLEMRYVKYRLGNGLAVTTSKPIELTLFENKEGWHNASKGQSYDSRDKTRNFGSVGVGRAWLKELDAFSTIETEVLKILRSQRIRLRLGNTVTASVRVDIKQDGLGKYTTHISYLITAKEQIIRDQVKTKGKGGLPFKEVCIDAESQGQKEIFERATENVNSWFSLMRDLATLGGIARLNDVLINQYGGTLGDVLDEEDEILFEAESLHCPLIKLTETKEKPSIPNDFRYARSRNIGMLTGATANGKSAYEVSVAQTSIMRQANLAVFAKKIKLMPRDNIIVQFPDYSGSLESESSRFAANCQTTSALLNLITPRTLFVFDEFGGGTDQDELGELMETIFGILGRRKKCLTLASTHYKRLARRLSTSTPSMVATAFDFGKNRKPTFTGKPGIATTSQTRYTANKNKLSDKKLRAIERSLEAKEKK